VRAEGGHIGLPEINRLDKPTENPTNFNRDLDLILTVKSISCPWVGSTAGWFGLGWVGSGWVEILQFSMGWVGSNMIKVGYYILMITQHTTLLRTVQVKYKKNWRFSTNISL